MIALHLWMSDRYDSSVSGGMARTEEPEGADFPAGRVPTPSFQLLIALAMFMIAPAAAAQFSTFRIVPERSVVRLSGSVVAFGLNWNLNYQALGSLDSPCEGALLVERSNNSVQLLQGKLAFRDTGSWEPDHFGKAGSAPANYGMRAGSDVANLRIVGRTALREVSISSGRTNLVLTNNTFLARRIPFQFLDRSVADYRFLLFMRDAIDPDSISIRRIPFFAPEPRVTAAGRAALTGFLENRATNTARFVVEQERETLVIPFNVRHRFTAVAPTGDQFRYDLFLDGEIVATAEPIVFFEHSPGASLRLWWPDGFGLQQSDSALSRTWLDLTGSPPLEIRAGVETAAGEFSAAYFRAVRLPPASR